MVMKPPFSSSEPEPPVTVKPKRKAPAKKAAPSPLEAPASRKSVAKKAPAKKTTARTVSAPAPDAASPPAPAAPSPSEPQRPARKLGLVEAATLKELQDAGVSHSALAASAIVMARNVDEAETAAGASAAARELRIVLPLARSLTNPLSPPAGSEKPPDDGEGDGTVVGPSRLTALRKRAEKRVSS